MNQDLFFCYLTFKLKPVQNGSVYSHRPSFIEHLPPLNDRKITFSKKPKIVNRGPLTLAKPVNEDKHYRRISDVIGNNYSPSAKGLNAKLIYEATKSGK